MLSILTRGESYGYEIIQHLHRHSGGKLAWGDGTLYPVLHRLEGEGLIASSWRRSEKGRKRKYYRITAAGEHALVQEKAYWLDMHAILVDLWGPELAL
ncbi:MAG: helix-turn-helix transcriptional regulator, partial [Bacteroidota bacterium]